MPKGCSKSEIVCCTLNFLNQDSIQLRLQAEMSVCNGVAETHKQDLYLGQNNFTFNPLGHSTLITSWQLLWFICININFLIYILISSLPFSILEPSQWLQQVNSGKKVLIFEGKSCMNWTTSWSVTWILWLRPLSSLIFIMEVTTVNTETTFSLSWSVSNK